MIKNWKTSLFGTLAGIAQISTVLAKSGITIGHYGGSDWLTLVGGLSTIAVGLYAKDHNVTGGTTIQSSEGAK